MKNGSGPLRLAWGYTAQPGQPHGYGMIAHRLPQALAMAGAEAVSGSSFDWDLRVIISQPVSWIVGDGKVRDIVWHTMYEAEPLVPGWADVLNRAGVVWAPSNWVRDLLLESGVRVPVFTCGYGVDHDVFYPVNRRGRNGPMKFIAWARGLVSRKNVLLAIRAFVVADLKDAVLEVKLNEDDALAPAGVSVGGATLENVRIIKADWPRHVLADWLRGADCLIYPSGGEGFGLMPLEAMATALPVICAYNTGMMDYLDENNAMLVPTKGRDRAINYIACFHYDCWLAKPDFDVLVGWIRWAYANREEAYEIGLRGHRTAREWTWEKTGERAYALMEDFLRRNRS